MLYRTLGKTDLKISSIGFGCWQLGGQLEVAGNPLSYGRIDEKEIGRAISIAIDLGVNFFDTADFYGLGKSEYNLGRELKAKRDSAVISTKVGHVPDGLHGSLTDGSFEHIIASCNRSLKRLNTDYIDLYLLHFAPSDEEINPAIEAFKKLKEMGKIREFGVSIASNFQSIDRLVGPDLFPVVEGYYNLILRDLEHSSNVLVSNNTGFIGASPLSRGLLTEKDFEKNEWDEADIRKKWAKGKEQHAWFLQQKVKVDRLKELASEWGMPLKSMALAFNLTRPWVSTVIPGIKTIKQIEDAVEASKLIPLDSELIRKIEAS